MENDPKPTETETAPLKEKKKTNHLVYVAWAFIFIGALALIQTVQAFIYEPLAAPNFLMVFLVVGWGLLKRKAMWRTFALSCAYVFVIFTAGKIIMVLRTPDALSGASTPQLIMFWLISILMVIGGGYAIWALQTKDVRAQFKSKM
ncbi:hypothetical protein [Cerasicoccus fimbriatus]|uniref:hypothetical protein n=1 Tax=Cerasicoccus fimbriatus TaxID=3014554 RepID=UPI0022B38556|nr:hypothetical protein [Cerasicoccus sp. TK19100]